MGSGALIIIIDVRHYNFHMCIDAYRNAHILFGQGKQGCLICADVYVLYFVVVYYNG